MATGETPFASYYTPDANEDHVFLTDCSVQWITKEIDGQPQSPIGIKYEISGPDALCAGTTYSISNLPSGSVLTWSATGAISISGSSSANPVAVTLNGTGAGTLTATISNASCQDVIIVKNINVSSPVGAPYEIYGFEEDQTVCSPGTLYLSVDDLYDSYVWTCEYTGTIGNGQSTANVEIGFPYGTSASSFWVECLVTSCGQSYSIHRNGTVIDCYFRSSYTIYPNPAAEEINISFGDEQSNKENRVVKNYEVRIFNEKGKMVKSAKNTSGSSIITISTSDIENGTYFLHIIDGKEIIKKQIIIQH